MVEQGGGRRGERFIHGEVVECIYLFLLPGFPSRFASPALCREPVMASKFKHDVRVRVRESVCELTPIVPQPFLSGSH